MARAYSHSDIRAKVNELASDSLEVIAEAMLGLEANLDAMTDERDELREQLSARQTTDREDGK